MKCLRIVAITRDNDETIRTMKQEQRDDYDNERRNVRGIQYVSPFATRRREPLPIKTCSMSIFLFTVGTVSFRHVFQLHTQLHTRTYINTRNNYSFY